MNQSQLDEQYFGWLYRRVRTVKRHDSPSSYAALCEAMYQMIFDWSTPNDDNRAADGVELRHEFLRIKDLDEDYYRDWLHRDATVFEVIVALCARASFMVEIGESRWFEIFIVNLGLHEYSDKNYTDQDSVEINHILRKFNTRRYTEHGEGGLFPLRDPQEDQRKVELWYQMAAYMNENEMY